MRRVICTAIIAAALATQIAAAPCVSPTFDVPFPGATDVTSHVTDLPSSVFPAFWQEGRLDGYDFQIFANATGVLRGGAQDQPWAIEIACDVSAGTCDFGPTGTPPEPATRVAERIGQCLVPSLAIADTTPTPEQSAPEQTEPEPVAVLDVAPEVEPQPCGLAVTNELTDVATMQRLLVLLGKDPGPVDGFLGPQSFSAMEAYVSNPGWGTPIADLVSVLSEQHCALTR